MSEENSREERSFPRMEKELLGLEEQLKKLFEHTQALHKFMGFTVVKTAPEDAPAPEKEMAPIIWIFAKLYTLKGMAEELNKLFHRPLSELCPDFYEKKTASEEPARPS